MSRPVGRSCLALGLMGLSGAVALELVPFASINQAQAQTKAAQKRLQPKMIVPKDASVKDVIESLKSIFGDVVVTEENGGIKVRGPGINIKIKKVDARVLAGAQLWNGTVSKNAAVPKAPAVEERRAEPPISVFKNASAPVQSEGAPRVSLVSDSNDMSLEQPIINGVADAEMLFVP